ncbi:MAG: sulfotransferase [Cyanobacteria bacterium P01_F01_bin.143]
MTFANLPILITGCQRSGTTLLKLILNSHPEIQVIDEDCFRNDNLADYLNNPKYHPFVAFKLPIFSSAIDSFAQLPGLRILWCLRDPRDVVLSMLNLVMGETNDGRALSWAQIPGGAEYEIHRTLSVLSAATHKSLNPWLKDFQTYVSTEPPLRQRSAALDTAALCWRLKNTLLGMYWNRGIEHHIVRYEQLIINPKKTLLNCLQFISSQRQLSWHDDLLCHHNLHQGHSVGNTDNQRPIDKNNTGKWRNLLSQEEIMRIEKITAPVSSALGYPPELINM